MALKLKKTVAQMLAEANAEIETIPPTTLPTRNLIDKTTGKLSGET